MRTISAFLSKHLQEASKACKGCARRREKLLGMLRAVETSQRKRQGLPPTPDEKPHEPPRQPKPPKKHG